MGRWRICGWCGESVLSSARKCKHCGEFLDATASSVSGPPSTEAGPVDFDEELQRARSDRLKAQEPQSKPVGITRDEARKRLPALRALEQAVAALSEMPRPIEGRREVRYDKSKPGWACSASFRFSDGTTGTYLTRTTSAPAEWILRGGVYGELRRLAAATPSSPGADSFLYRESPSHHVAKSMAPSIRPFVEWVPVWPKAESRRFRPNAATHETRSILVYIAYSGAPLLEVSTGGLVIGNGSEDTRNAGRPVARSVEELIQIGSTTVWSGGRESEPLELDAEYCITHWVRAIAEAMA